MVSRERPMTLRPLAPALVLGLLVRPVPAQVGIPPGRSENVIVVTLDGFRHQEFFAGADAALIDARAGGVPDAEGLGRRFGGETAEVRRRRLLPFLWGTVAREGQIFGDRSRRAPARLTNGQKVSYPGYNEIF